MLARAPIKISLQQLRIAAKKPRKGAPCHNEMMKVMDLLKDAEYHIAPVYKHILEYDKCIDAAKAQRKRGKASTLYHLSKYLDNNKNKKR
mmetsp:Transcript_27974/g.39336  ORF Transcript_27974/g.39336 Transcript_27974/m.39336 type:complete len:90 (-) Transcript_27974:117-386(-)